MMNPAVNSSGYGPSGGVARDLGRNWVWVVLRGVLALILGLFFLFDQAGTMLATIWVFGAFALVFGVTGLIAGIRSEGGAKMPLILEGVLGILAGIIAFAWPGLTLLTFVYFIGAWAIITGIVQIYEAIKLRDEIDNEWWLVLGGIASLVFGILVIASPLLGLFTIATLLGIYGVLFGILIIVLGFRLKGLQR
ncbi:MAG: HdeD family acid-resistance protein [Thermomicrobiales bacterium]|nr:HdeD family acid-resistance protein [Thermomicrobiales bacterium]